MQKELSKRHLRTPQNPLLYKREWSDESARAFWAEWYAHKHDRKVLAEVAGQVLKHKTSSRAAYERLNVLGYRFKKYGQVTDYERRLLKVEFEDYYWKAFWKLALGFNRHGQWCREDRRDLDKELESHAKARQEWADTQRQARSLRDQIQAIEQLKKVMPIATERGLQHL